MAKAFALGEAEAMSTDTAAWVVTADATYRGGSGRQRTVAGAETVSVKETVYPYYYSPDDYSGGEAQMEIWARMELASTLVSPVVVTLVRPGFSTANTGDVRYTGEYGAAGKLLTVPSSGTQFRFVRLGIVNVTTAASDLAPYNLLIEVTTAAGSTGTLGIDYVILVWARGRALSPTGVANDTNYPTFAGSTTASTKTIYSDLSATVMPGENVQGGAQLWPYPDHGLGGRLLEWPIGDLEMIGKLSSLVPDDPTSDATSEQLAHTAMVHAAVTPRYHLLRGS